MKRVTAERNRLKEERNKLKTELEAIRKAADDYHPIYHVLQTTLDEEEFDLSYIALNYSASKYVQIANCLKGLHRDTLRHLPDEELRKQLIEDINAFLEDGIVMRRFIERVRKKNENEKF